MDKKTSGYVAGIFCLFIFIVFFILSANNEFNTSGQILWGFSALFGGLTVGSFWKPETFGNAVAKFLESFSENASDKSDSHDYKPQGQTMQESHGSYQVMAQRDVTINVPSEKKEDRLHPEEKEFLRRETIVVRPSKGYSYEFDLEEGDYLKGEISSSSCITIYLVDDVDFDKWESDEDFDCEYSNEDILDTDINSFIPDDGKWYLIIENNGRKTAKVKVQLYVT